MSDRAVTAPAPVIVAFTPDAERRAVEGGLALPKLAELLLAHHHRRLRHPGDADWILHAAGVAIVYDWPTVTTPRQPSSSALGGGSLRSR